MDSRTEQACSVQFLDADGLRALDSVQWDELSATALAENPYYSRRYVLAGLNTIDRQAGVRAIAIRDQYGRLAGLFPYQQKHRLPFPWSIACGAENLYQFNGMPLVAEHIAESVIATWLDLLPGGKVSKFWTLPNFDLGNRFYTMLEAGIAERNLMLRTVVPYTRPYLTRLPDGFDAHLSTVIAKRRLKDIQRNLRRLREKGDLVFERVSDPKLVDVRLEQFLELEGQGWKGQSGTAFIVNAEHARFAREAFGNSEDGTGLTTIDSLLLDGKPIATSINIATGRTAFTPKGAYDESLRRYSPGLVLEYLVISRLYEQDEFADMDASTTTDGHVVLGLWNSQKDMARLIIGPDDWRTSLLATGWEAAHAKKEDIKRLIGRKDAAG